MSELHSFSVSLPVLEVDNLKVEFASRASSVRAVNDVSFELYQREIVAIVGESGSGKSILLQSILGIARGRPGVVGGKVIVRARSGAVIQPYEGIERGVTSQFQADGSMRALAVRRSFRTTVEARAKSIRGAIIGLVLQNGRAALDPFWKIGRQIAGALKARHGRLPKAELRARGERWLQRLGFEDPARIMDSFPHQLSGGMAQRALLAVVLAREPEILFLDEITTGLDVSLQAAVLELVRELHAELGFSALLVTHDLGIARAISTRTLVMKKGQIVQSSPTRELFEGRVKLEAYTAQLLDSGEKAFANTRKSIAARTTFGGVPILRAEVELVSKRFAQSESVPAVLRRSARQALARVRSLGRGASTAAPAPAEASARALSEVSLRVYRGECVALVGESGSGKTTLSRILMGLLNPDAGRILHDGSVLGELDESGLRNFRKNRTILFQNPYTSLNPAMTAEGVIAEALRLYQSLDPEQAQREAGRVLREMGLEERAQRQLRLLSGGERRRVGLLRAIQSRADLLVLDEPTAGLDALHRVRVAELLAACRAQAHAPAIVIVSHDLGFVTSVADRIVVLYRGAVVEECDVWWLLQGCMPRHAYTRRLWRAARYVAGDPDVEEEEPTLVNVRAPSHYKDAGGPGRSRGGFHVSD